MFESDIMLSVSMKNVEDRARIWQELKFCGERILKQRPDAQIILTANDEETIEEVSAADIPVLNTQQVNQIHEIVYKSLLAQDTATYHEMSGDLSDRADKTVRKIILALQ